MPDNQLNLKCFLQIEIFFKGSDSINYGLLNVQLSIVRFNKVSVSHEISDNFYIFENAEKEYGLEVFTSHYPQINNNNDTNANFNNFFIGENDLRIITFEFNNKMKY